MSDQLPIISVFILYFILVLIFGFVATRVTKNLSDYMLGGRRLSAAITALGAGASDMSGWLLLALPGSIYAFGLSQMWLPVGLVIGAYINWRFVAKRLRVYTEHASNSLTIPAYFDHRFQDSTGILRTATALAILVFFTFYAAANFVAGALLFQSTFHLNYEIALVISVLFIVVYTSIGGFLAVNWVDFFQGTLMFFALLIVPLVAIHHLGGLPHAFNIIHQTNPDHLRPFSNLSLAVISSIAWGLGYFGQPHILVRFMACRSVPELPKARRICMSWMTISLLGAVATGLIGYAFYISRPLEKPESVFLALTHELFQPWLAGILLAAVLSAIMSSVAAMLLASSSALTEDIYHRFFRRKSSERELIAVSRLSVVLIAVIAGFLARNPQGTILNLVGYAWAGLGAAFGPVILFSLYWKNMTKAGAIAGILIGGSTVVIWKNLQFLGGIFKLYEIVPGFLLASIAVVVVSLYSTKPSSEIQQQFREVEKIVAQ